MQDEQREFYDYVKKNGLSGPDKVAKLKVMLSITECQSDSFAENGQFLPLTVWGTQGFNVHDIETKSLSCDKRQHPVLGGSGRRRESRLQPGRFHLA